MTLQNIAREMLDLTRFGCDIIRLTKPKKKVKRKKGLKDDDAEETFEDPYQSHLSAGGQHKAEEIPNDQEPYGPIQVRFCQGARTPIDPGSAAKIANTLEEKVRAIINPYREGLVKRVKTLLMEQRLENAEKILELCEWIDHLDGDFLQVDICEAVQADPQRGTQARPATAMMALSAAWVCYFEEKEMDQATIMATKLKGVFETIRAGRLNSLAQNLSKALDHKPISNQA